MRPQLPETTKLEVIRLWLMGYSRDEIARLTDISAGAVTNIVDKCKIDIGKPEADSLRQLAKSIRASGLTPSQCAVGLRISNILEKIGINLNEADSVEHFLSDTYKKCISHEITPEKIASHIVDLANFSDKVRLPEIEEYVNEKAAKIKAISEQESGLINDISALQQKKSQEEKSLEETLEQTKRIEYQILLFNDAKALLDQFNLTITEFAENLKDLIAWGGEPKMIVAKFEEMKEFDREKQARKEELELMGRKLINLKHEYSSVQNLNNSYSEKIDILKKLDALGIDLMEFYDTIMLISTSNGIPIHLAFNKFSQDVREHYDLVLGFESRKESLKSEIQSLDFKLGKRIEEEQENEKKDLNYLKGSGINFVLGDRTFEL